MRVAILWKQMSGYADACFSALTDKGVEVILIHRATTDDAPFVETNSDRARSALSWVAKPDEALLRRQVKIFAPDALLVISWDVGAYRRLSGSLQGRTLRILCMDNQWLGTPKQWAGRLIAPVVIKPAYDVAFIPGERQATFARYLGFSDEEIMWGLYACEQPVFAAIQEARGSNPPPGRFLFVGRLVDVKAPEIVAAAYQLYRSRTTEPWPLTVCGTGPGAALFDGIPGVEMLGFVQPRDLPEVFARCGCLLQPSRFEPWGVTIHEAVSAGLAVICSSACGASTRLVLDGYNGSVIPTGNVECLAQSMFSHAAHGSERATISRRSFELSRQFTPDRWASYLVEQIGSHRRRLGLGATK